MDQDERPPRKQGEQTPMDPSGQAVSEATTWVDARPPFDGTKEDTLQANQYLGRGVARLWSPPAALGSELTPLSDECVTPGLLTPECDTTDEHQSSLTDVMPPTELPDVRRALEALRAGKSVKPPGTEPGPGATPSAASAPSGTSSAPATEKGVKHSPTGRNVWPSRVAIGVLAVGGWMAAGATAVFHVHKSKAGFMAPLSVLSAPSALTAAPVLSAPRDRIEPMADPTALQKIAEIPVAELTPEQCVMLASERARKRSEELKELASRLDQDGGDRLSQDAIATLREAARDPQTAPQALLAMTALHGTVGADLIYQVANDGRLSAETRRLASDLLGTKAVQAHVSKALRVVLDLSRVKTCDEAEQVVMRVFEAGDRRTLAGLRKLYGTRGCGPYQANDCYPCLRKSALLNRSVEAARRRRPPF